MQLAANGIKDTGSPFGATVHTQHDLSVMQILLPQVYISAGNSPQPENAIHAYST